MKYLFLSLILCSCINSPKPLFKVGDCVIGQVVTTNPNGHNPKNLINKVTKINNNGSYDFDLLWLKANDNKYHILPDKGYFENDSERTLVKCPLDSEISVD